MALIIYSPFLVIISFWCFKQIQCKTHLEGPKYKGIKCCLHGHSAFWKQSYQKIWPSMVSLWYWRLPVNDDLRGFPARVIFKIFNNWPNWALTWAVIWWSLDQSEWILALHSMSSCHRMLWLEASLARNHFWSTQSASGHRASHEEWLGLCFTTIQEDLFHPNLWPRCNLVFVMPGMIAAQPKRKLPGFSTLSHRLWPLYHACSANIATQPFLNKLHFQTCPRCFPVRANVCLQVSSHQYEKGNP